MRHFDVQLMGAMALHDGKISEMRTGEGKTLVATLAVYLNSLSDNGVHVVTVNDYLAKRDAEWMGKLYNFLGLSVGVNLSRMDPKDKKSAYLSDITYGTNNEFGFDYLRDNMVYSKEDRVQRALTYAVVDEVDSILIDEARTPLVISGQSEDNIDLYSKIDKVVSQLKRQEKEDSKGDFWVDEKAHQVILSDKGHENTEVVLERLGILPKGSNLYDLEKDLTNHYLINDCSYLSCIKTKTNKEGLLLPDTYYYFRGMKLSSIFSASNEKLNKLINTLWLEKPQDNPLKSKYDALILASIIEKEAGNNEEKLLNKTGKK